MKVGIFNMSKFVKVAIDHSEGMAICESALFDVYCVESPEETITLEDFKQKVKDTASKVWAKILSWFKKVKEFFKSIWNWITKHWNAFVDRFRGKKTMPDPKAMEDANTAYLKAHNCLVRAVSIKDDAVIANALAEAEDYFNIGNDKVREANENQVEAKPEDIKKAINVRVKYTHTAEELVTLGQKIAEGNAEYKSNAIRQKVGRALMSVGAYFAKANVNQTIGMIGKTGDPEVDDKASSVKTEKAA